MNKTETESQFRAYIETCQSNSENLEIVGIGNPYAKILVVGLDSAEKGIRKIIEDAIACLNNSDFHKCTTSLASMRIEKEIMGKGILIGLGTPIKS